MVVQRCVGEKLLYEGGRSDRRVLYPLSCRRIIRADKSQRNTLYREGVSERERERKGGGGRESDSVGGRRWFSAKLKVRIASGAQGGGEGLGNRVPMPHYTDRLSFAHSRGSYFRLARVKTSLHPSLSHPLYRCHLLHRTAPSYPSARPIRRPLPPSVAVTI